MTRALADGLQRSKSTLFGIVKSLGLVFGDIGTSPAYTLTAVFLTLPVTQGNILGVLSLVCWTLVLLVFVEYALLAMSLSKKGEGGTIVLKELLIPLLKNKKTISFVSLLSYLGISLLVGDGFVTPAINILSAVEGLKLVPQLQGLPPVCYFMVAMILTCCLFVFQKKGTDRVALAFGPIMLLWFIILATSGVLAIVRVPEVLQALNPLIAVNFLRTHGLAGFFILSEVILCATGCEALYADMGHLGRAPIRHASYFVLICLMLTYLGQGAFLSLYPGTKFVFYEMLYKQLGSFYLPFLGLSCMAFIIASQAMISGLFSIVYQGITTKILPKFKIDYTSSHFRAQIYVGFVNWLLMGVVIGLILFFKTSYNLTNAYGLAVTGTMSVTGTMMAMVFFLRKNYFKFLCAAFITVIDLAFFLANMYKIPHGGYISILLAMVPFSLILIYINGQRRMYAALKPKQLGDFLEKYSHAYKNIAHIKGTALFFTKDLNAITPFITQTMFKNNIIYEDNVLVSIITRDDPFGVISFFKGELAPGLRIFEIHMGYMTIIDIEKILHNAGINAKVIFYSLEEIVAKSLIWRVFAFIKKVTPSFVQFYKLPPNKLHGVVTLIEI